jgi:hypothetical protein
VPRRPALQVFREILKDQGHPHRFVAAKEVLERSHLSAVGVEPKASFSPAQHVNVNTQVNSGLIIAECWTD